MKIYNFDSRGMFTCESIADESPLESGIFLIPANATPIAPPDLSANEIAVFNDGAWSVIHVQEPQEIEQRPINALIPLTHQPSYADQRAAEYPPIADYIDGIVKSDAAQVQTYIEACLAVKAKYPKPA